MMTRIDHLLVILGEEGAEVIQAAAKALRFGLDDGYPGTERTNAQDIANEIDDFIAVAEMLREAGSIPPSDPARISAKKARVAKWLRYSREKGK